MSEYQYYEFRAVDRVLTREEMAELRRVSSRGLISPTSYVNEYEWGDFKGNPDEWMDRYFDAFLYHANWGTKTLKLRIPGALLSAKAVAIFENGESLTSRTNGKSTIIDFNLDPYEPSDEWEDYEGLMASLIGLRTELLGGDFRVLYLGWLIGRGLNGVVDDVYASQLEPPLPAGLQELTASQKAFIDFFEIDQDLLQAAAEASPVISPVESGNLIDWISRIADAEKIEYLSRVVSGSGVGVGLELSARFKSETSRAAAIPDSTRRTVGQLNDRARSVRSMRRQLEQEQREISKKNKLDELLGRLPAVWNQIENHADTKKVNHYDMAVALLIDVSELAKRGDVPNFGQFIADFRARHATKRALLERMDKARLLS